MDWPGLPDLPAQGASVQWMNQEMNASVLRQDVRRRFRDMSQIIMMGVAGLLATGKKWPAFKVQRLSSVVQTQMQEPRMRWALVRLHIQLFPAGLASPWAEVGRMLGLAVGACLLQNTTGVPFIRMVFPPKADAPAAPARPAPAKTEEQQSTELTRELAGVVGELDVVKGMVGGGGAAQHASKPQPQAQQLPPHLRAAADAAAAAASGTPDSETEGDGEMDPAAHLDALAAMAADDDNPLAGM